jgi:hypothetical protein
VEKKRERNREREKEKRKNLKRFFFSSFFPPPPFPRFPSLPIQFLILHYSCEPFSTERKRKRKRKREEERKASSRGFVREKMFP